jgi:RecA/RadA recombinase
MPSAADIFAGELGSGAVYFIYGAGGVGKTTLAVCAAARVMKKGRPVVWVDCGGRLYLPRLHQLLEAAGADPDMMYISLPKTFQEQSEAILKLADRLPTNTGLVVVDDFTYLHRLALSGDVSQDLHIYEMLAFQAALIKEVSAERNLPAILIGHVHEIPQLGVKAPVASRIVTFWADVVFNVNYEGGVRVVVEEKPGTGRIFFRISEAGAFPT